MDRSEPVVVARTWMKSEASVIKNLLGSYNIPCSYSSEMLDRLYPAPEDEQGQIKVYVSASLAEEARRILEEHRRYEAPFHAAEDRE